MRRWPLCGLLVAAAAALGALGAAGQFASASSAQPNGTCGFCVLDPSGESLKLTASGALSLTGSNAIVDSSSKPALVLSGSGSLKAPSVGVVGTAAITGSGKVENLTTGVAAVADPLASLGVPALPVPNPVPSASVTGSSGKTISPGVYNEITDTASGSLTLSPGTYVVRKKFANTGSGALTADGVSLYLGCANYPTPCKSGEKGATLALTGSGPMHFTAPDETCAPVAIFSDRNSTAPIAITGSGSQTLDGVIYAKSGPLALTGSGGTFALGGPIVVGSATVSGSGSISLGGSLPLNEGIALSLSTSSATPRVGEGETLTATLSCRGKPLENVPVSFGVSGANNAAGSATTNSSGVATFAYTGTATGVDTAEASYTTNGASVTSSPSTVTWSKAKPAIGTSPAASTVTIGESISDTATLSGGYSPTGTVSFNVYAANDATCKTAVNSEPLTATLSGGKATSPPYEPRTPGTYQFVASYAGDAENEATEGKCGEASEQVTVNGVIGPVVTQPQNETADEGSSASFTATADANPGASVQWQLSTDEGKTWSDDSADSASTSSEGGKTTSALTIAGTTRGESGQRYRAVFTNSAGSVTSNAATLAVDSIGPISTQPESATVGEGHGVTFTAAAVATPGASAQWQVSTTDGMTWEDDTADTASTASEGTTTTSTLTIPGPTRAQNGYEYRVVLTNSAGSATSNAATLTVNWTGPVERQPESVTVNEGASASFTATAGANPAASVQWQVSADEGKTWTDDTIDTASSTVEGNATTSTLTVAAATRAQNGYEYRAAFTNAAGSATSKPAILGVSWIGPVEAQPQSTTVNESSPASFKVTVSANPAESLEWQVSTDEGKTWNADGDNSSSVSEGATTTTSTLTIAAATRSENGYEYRAVITNGAGSVTSSPATLTVDWIGPVETQPESQTVVEGTSASFTAAAASNPGASVQWQLSSDSGVEWANDTADAATTTSSATATTSTLTVSSVTHSQTGYEYRAVFTNGAGAATSSLAILTVERSSPCTDNYTGPNNGLWQTAANWSTGKTPTASDVACVGAGTTVDVTQGNNAAGVLLDQGGLAISGGQLELASPPSLVSMPGLESSTTAALSMTSGTLDLAGKLEVGSSLTSSGTGALVSGSGRLQVDAGATGTLNNGGACNYLRLSGVTLVNEGTLADGPTPASNGDVIMESGAKLENQGTLNVRAYDQGCFTSNHYSFYDWSGSPSIANTGTLNAEYGAGHAGELLVSLANEGALNVKSGELRMIGGGSGANGSWNAASGAALAFPGSAYAFSGDTWGGEGTIALNGASLSAAGVQVNGHVSLTGGTFSVPEGKESSFNPGSSFTTSGGSGTIAGAGDLLVKSGAIATLNSGASCNVTRMNTITLVNQGTLVDGASPASNGDVIMESGAKVENQGTFDLRAYDQGCFTSNHDSFYDWSGSPSITNAGTFSIEYGSGHAGEVTVPFANSATVNAQSGTADFSGGGSSSSGTWSAGAGAALAFTGRSFAFAGDKWTGAGTIAVAGASVTAANLQPVEAAVAVSSGSLTLPAGSTTTIGTASLTGGTLSVGGTLELRSSFTTSGSSGTIAGAGDLLVKSGATAALNSGASCNVTRMNTITLVNQGTLVDGASPASNGDVIMESGAKLENQGTFDLRAYDQGCFTSSHYSFYNWSGSPSITNTGTLNVEYGAGHTGEIPVSFSNQATLNVKSGELRMAGGGSDTAATWNTESGATLSFAGGNYTLNGDTWSGGGALALAGANVSAPGVQINGHSVLTSGTLSIPQAATTDVNPGSSFTTSGSSGTIAGGGDLVVKAGATAALNSGASCNVTRMNAITLVNQGTVVDGASAGSSGDVIMESGAKLENQGTLDLRSYDQGCFTGSHDSFYNYSGSPSITNTGTLNAEVGGGHAGEIPVAFTNHGAVNVTSGELRMIGGGSGSAATWNTASGTALSFAGGTFALNGDTLSGEGTLALAGANVSAPGVQINTHSVLTSGTLSIPQAATADLNSGSSFTTSGSSGTISGGGDLLVKSGATAALNDGSSCNVTRMNAITLVNQGTVLDGASAGSSGDVMMESGAKIENQGTLDLRAYDQGCFTSSHDSFFDYSGSPSITNTGTLNAEYGSSHTGEIPVAFLNDGTVNAQSGTAQFAGGGIGEQVATGCWYAQSGAAILFTAGTFTIEEGGAFQVSVQGAHVNFSPNGLHATLEAPRYAAGTMTLAGHGEETNTSYIFSSATFEATKAGANEWKPITGSLTPEPSGDFGAQWNTASGAYPDGRYEVRAKVSNNCACQKSAYSPVSSVRVANAPLTLQPQKAGPDPVGSAQSFTAMLSDSAGAPIVGKTVVLNVHGADTQTLEAVTNSEGVATFSYTGHGEGEDTVQASYAPSEGPTVTSNTATVSWFFIQREVTSTPVQGNFFHAETSVNGFSAKPGETPAFSQTFPTIDFNPPAGTVRRDPWYVDSTTRPFTDLTTDQAGQTNGESPAEGNGLQAGVGSLESFEAEFTASFNVAAAGDVTFHVTSEDGFMLGVGGGASRVSGPYENAPESNKSVFQGLPLAAAYNKTCCSTPQMYSVTVHFPSAGTYPYELDYFQHGSQQLALTMNVASLAATNAPVSVYVGYADGLRPAGSVFPFPWNGSPGVLFEGCTTSCSYDGGAVRVANNTGTSVNVNSVLVHFSAACTYDIWPHNISLGADEQLIVDQTKSGASNGCTPSEGTMDSSDIGTNGAPWSGDCNQSGMIPEVDVTVNGVLSSYQDTKQVLNTGGVDSASCGAGNESEAWQLIGGGGTPIEIPLPPAVSLQLSPSAVAGDEVGQSQKLTVTAHDAAGKPVSGLAINVHVFGPNGQDLGVSTNSEGIAETSYVGKNAGKDVVSATASVEGLQNASNQLTVPWAVPAPPPLPPAPPEQSGAEPPSIESLHPEAGSIVTGPSPLTAKITSASAITGWKATLAPAGGGPTTTLGEGSSTPPQTLGTIEPAKLGEGSYRLTVSAETAGGSASASGPITIGGTPGIPPPPPQSSGGAPTLSQITPPNGSVIGAKTAVSATASPPAGQKISGWKVTLAPQGGGSAATLAESTQEAPSPLATIDPAKFSPGTYTLAVTATASGGGYATEFETVTLGTGATTTTSTTTSSSTSTTESTSTTTSATTSTSTTATTPSESTTTGTTTSSTSTSSSAVAPPPSIGAISPESGTVVTTPVPIKAAVKAAEGESIASWSVVYRGSRESSSTTLAHGTGNPPETLATFDPTKLANDTYTVTVLATSTGGAVQSSSSTLLVSGNLKLGRFLQTYKDLEVPVAGFAMRVERLYDSNDKSVGDFGVGWHLQLSGFKVAANGPLGKGGWSASPANCTFSICGYQYESSPEHTVTVTWPDKHQEVFVFEPSGQPLNNIEVEPHFSPKSGTNTTARLEAYEPSEIDNGFDGNLYDGAGGYWNDTRFMLTTREGRKYLLSTETGLLAEEDTTGNKLTFSSNGVESSSGPKLALTRDSQGRISEITGPAGQHLKYGYDAAGDLTSYTSAEGNSTRYGYDSDHNLTSITGPGDSKPLQQQVYNSEGRLSEIIDSEGHVTKISTDPNARTETLVDPNGKLTEVNTYDALGDPIEEVDAFEGHTLTTKHAFDAEGHLLSTTDPEGNVTSRNTWEGGRLASHTDANNATTKFEYNSSGALTGVIGPDGKRKLAITRNAAGQPTKVEHGGGATYSYTYNAQGKPTQVSEPNGVTRNIEYDSEGHPITVKGPAGTTKYSYNSAGQLTSETSSTGASTSYEYDSAGHVTAITDGLEQKTSFKFSPFGQDLMETDQLGHSETFTYDESGHLTKRVDGSGEVTTYAYDADGQVTEEDNADGEYRHIAYNGLERPTSMANQTQTLTFGYDANGNPTEASASAVGAAPATTLKYGYDAAGHRTSLSGPEGTTTYTYNELSQLSTLTPAGEPGGKGFGFSYTPEGHLAGITRPDAIDDTLTYSGEQLVSRIARLGSGVVASSAYGYNAAALRSSLTEAEGASTGYGYNGAGEVTEEAPSSAAPTTYEYDAAGNRSHMSGPGGALTYAYNGDNELTGDGRENFTYNADGELESSTAIATGAVTHYEWNASHELSAIHLPDGESESFAYDPLGRRVSVTAGGRSTSYVYDRQNVHLEYQEGGGSSPSAVYTDGLDPNEVLEMTRGGKRYSYLVDGQGSTTALADEEGNVVDRYSYDAFGTPTVSGAVPNPFLYTGQQWDPTSGLYYYHARYYDPTIARFISRDPLTSANRYAYVRNDPTNATDPTGKQFLAEQEATMDDEDIIEKTQVEYVEGELNVALELLKKGLTEEISGFSADQAALGEANSGFEAGQGQAEAMQEAIARFEQGLSEAHDFIDEVKELPGASQLIDKASEIEQLKKGLDLIENLGPWLYAAYETYSFAKG